eukprot:6965275-Alexandrium_andersonii.AAC.1
MSLLMAADSFGPDVGIFPEERLFTVRPMRFVGLTRAVTARAARFAGGAAGDKGAARALELHGRPLDQATA